MEFITWNELVTYSGALVMVLIITQLTKDVKILKSLPTQLWSYIVSLMVLYPACFFTGELTASNAVLIIFNSAIIALTANGGFDALAKAFPNIFKKL